MKLCPRCEEAFADDAAFCPFDGAALTRANDALLGRTLAARYRLVRRLGSGGMAVVYLARHVMIERRSAIKILRQDLGINPAHRERFLREARAVNRINHPNIVQITDFGEDGGLVFLVMEYFDGEPLRAALEGGPFACNRAARIAVQIASALARAHQLGVIHRDLKPDNVLLRTRDIDEIVKLTDFGIAKLLDAPAITFGEQRFGTPGYIPPEYLEGAPASPQGDLYSLGIALYQMLTGALPWDARAPGDLLALQLREPPVPPGVRSPGIPVELEQLVLRLIARKPEDRPLDAFAVVDALEDVLLGMGGFSAPPARISDAGPREGTIHAMQTTDAGARWRASLARLGREVERVGRLSGESEPRVRRARDLVEVALSLVASLERAGATAGEHQARVDRLESESHAFRGSLGKAIDTLSRDRSRERSRMESCAARRLGLEAEARGGADVGAVAAELSTVADEDQRAREAEADLSYQIETLERQLEAMNERVEAQLADATGRLEGVLSAIRRITRELAKTREDAERELA
jgi:eukaryotic-like serine/threonine-protein kinase